MDTEDGTVSDYDDPVPNPETPWEFLPDDDADEPEGRSAEDEAMHLVGLGMPVVDPEVPETDVVVHYLDDEHPELPDKSVKQRRDDETPEVESLLIRQHYMTPDE